MTAFSAVGADQLWIDGLRRTYRQGIIIARCSYNDATSQRARRDADTPTPEPYFCDMPGALVAARNTAVGMLQNGYDLVSVVTDKALSAGSVPYGDATSFFGEKPDLTPAQEAEESRRAKFAVEAENKGCLLWKSVPCLPQTSIIECIGAAAMAKPTTLDDKHKGPANTNTELTVYLVGHGFKDDEGRFTLAFNAASVTYQDEKEKVAGGYTMTQLLFDLTLLSRWRHLLIIADACSAGAALNADCFVPDEAQAFIDVAWREQYDRPSYQFIGASLSNTSALIGTAWQGTVLSMAMQEVLWCANPTAFAGESDGELCNWATVGHVQEKLRECMNSIMLKLGYSHLSPTCVRGRLTLPQLSLESANIGQFLFVRKDSPPLWPFKAVNIPPNSQRIVANGDGQRTTRNRLVAPPTVTPVTVEWRKILILSVVAVVFSAFLAVYCTQSTVPLVHAFTLTGGECQYGHVKGKARATWDAQSSSYHVRVDCNIIAGTATPDYRTLVLEPNDRVQTINRRGPQRYKGLKKKPRDYMEAKFSLHGTDLRIEYNRCKRDNGWNPTYTTDLRTWCKEGDESCIKT